MFPDESKEVDRFYEVKSGSIEEQQVKLQQRKLERMILRFK